MAARSAVSEMLRTRGSRVLILDSLPRFRSLSDSAIGFYTLRTSYSSSIPFALLLVSGPCQARGIQSQPRVARQVDRRRNPALPLRCEELASHRIARH